MTPLKLNLGGRNKPIPGFQTVDLFDGPGVDIKSDISRLEGIANGAVDEIYASHCLEHFPHVKTREVLTEWRRVLKTRGKAYISVPDFDAMVKLYLQFGMTDFIRNMLYGDQVYDLAYHYTVFTYPTLARALMEVGFEDVKRLADMPYGIDDCSQKVDTATGKPVSINVEAVA